MCRFHSRSLEILTPRYLALKTPCRWWPWNSKSQILPSTSHAHDAFVSDDVKMESVYTFSMTRPTDMTQCAWLRVRCSLLFISADTNNNAVNRTAYTCMFGRCLHNNILDLVFYRWTYFVVFSWVDVTSSCMVMLNTMWYNDWTPNVISSCIEVSAGHRCDI